MRIYTIIFLAFFANISCTQNSNSKAENLKGKIKCISTSNYEVSIVDGQYQKGAKRNGVLDSEVNNCFDTLGNLISLDNTISYHYNDKNLLVEITNKRSVIEKLDYNQKNQLINKTQFDENGKIVGFVSYSYDNNNNLIEEQVSNIIPPTTYKYFYNSKKLLTKTEAFKTEDISSAKVFGSKPVARSYIEYKYDTENRISEKSQIEESRKDESSYLYDNYGNIILELHYIDKKSDGTSYGTVARKYIYKYDNLGNWINCIQIVNDKPQILQERIIEYY